LLKAPLQNHLFSIKSSGLNIVDHSTPNLTRKSGKLLVCFLLFIILAPLLQSTSFALAQESPSLSSLRSARVSVSQAFSAVLSAEKAGANVSQLVVQLNSAVVVLAKAEMSYRNGNFSVAQSAANSVVSLISNVPGRALQAKNAALADASNTLLLYFVVFILGLVVVVEVLMYVWKSTKRKYVKKLLTAKPEVATQPA
jgi:hypothetical protein